MLCDDPDTPHQPSKNLKVFVTYLRTDQQTHQVCARAAIKYKNALCKVLRRTLKFQWVLARTAERSAPPWMGRAAGFNQVQLEACAHPNLQTLSTTGLITNRQAGGIVIMVIGRTGTSY